ncbi:GNAT family N-acetyltransferase [Candidatus Chlorohelix sp.]|uniref:GNAT family N-acetyltransferase n=1 Tax=Candidatus Chlorohelix sp. TaxID=3139201 RepID=UPI003027B446
MQINELEVGQFESYEMESYSGFFQSIGPSMMDLGLNIIVSNGLFQFACTEAPNVSFLNRVLGLGLGKPASSDAIERVVKRAYALKVSCTVYTIENYSKPSELPILLKERGFTLKARSSVLAYIPGNMASLVEDHSVEAQIRLVTSEQREEFAQVVCEGFELRGGFRRAWEAISMASVGHPQQICFMAYIHDQPAGGATLFLSKDGKYAGLYSASTLPDFRQHGVQSALLRAMLEEALRRGRKIITAQTPYGGSAERNLHRLGLETAYVRESYFLPSRR